MLQTLKIYDILYTILTHYQNFDKNFIANYSCCEKRTANSKQHYNNLQQIFTF